MTAPLTKFDKEITAFNKMYGLPCPDSPTIAAFPSKQQLISRLTAFKSILLEEVEEVEEIIAKTTAGDMPEEIMTELADWLGDIQVYCASELRKFGLENSVVLSAIMASNASKLGPDGKPIYDARGKVMKGPGYWRPEPMIRRYIDAAIRQGYKE